MYPCTPSRITSWKPEIRLATTGRPQLIASSSTMPNDARLQGVQNTSPLTRWLGRLRFSRPAKWANCAQLVAHLVVVPLAQRAVADHDEPHLVARARRAAG